MEIEQKVFPSYAAAKERLDEAKQEINACKDKRELWNWHQEKGNATFGKMRDFDMQVGGYRDDISYNHQLHSAWADKLCELDMNSLLSSFGNYYQQYKANQESL